VQTVTQGKQEGIMADRSERREKIKGYAAIIGGIVIEGIGVKANPAYLTAPVDVATKTATSLGTGSVPDIATVIAHVPFDVWNALVNAGPGGIAAGIAMGFGLWLVGKGAIINHEANSAASNKFDGR
jgi:hypothetical protein